MKRILSLLLLAALAGALVGERHTLDPQGDPVESCWTWCWPSPRRRASPPPSPRG